MSDHATLRDLLAVRSGLPAHAGDELLAFGYGRAEVLRRLRYLAPADGFRAAYAEQEALPTAAAVAAERATAQPGDAIIFVSDGILDAEDDEGAMYGEERVPHLLCASRDNPPAEIADAILADVARFQGAHDRFDDETIIVLRVR